MMGRIIKYEWKALWRSFLISWLILLFAAFFVRVQGVHLYSYIMTGSGLFFLFYFCIAAAISCILMILLVRRLYRTLYGRAGTVTNTLPLSAGELLRGKIVSQSLLLLVTGVLILLSLLIVMSGFTSGMEGALYSLGDLFLMMLYSSGAFLGAAALLYVFLIPAKIVTGIVTVLTLGQLFRKHKIAGAVGVYLVVQLILDLITLLIEQLLFMIFPTASYELTAFAAELPGALLVIFGGYLLSRWLLSRKLDLCVPFSAR